MSKINKNSTVTEIAAIVSQKLIDEGINAVLSGGAVVSIYTDNEYESKDLDFVCGSAIKEIEGALSEVGFKKTESRYFSHPNTDYFVEFPNSPLAIGDEIQEDWGTLDTDDGRILLLTPTQSVMDRLAAYYFWNDLQGLDQAIMVANKHPIKISKIESWSKAEGETKKYENFLSKYTK